MLAFFHPRFSVEGIRLEGYMGRNSKARGTVTAVAYLLQQERA